MLKKQTEQTNTKISSIIGADMVVEGNRHDPRGGRRHR